MQTPHCVKRSKTVDGEKELRLYMIPYPNRTEFEIREERMRKGIKDISIIRAVPTTNPEAAMDNYYELLMAEQHWEVLD